MIKRFLHGLIFGFGFCVAVGIFLYFWLNVGFVSKTYTSEPTEYTRPSSIEIPDELKNTNPDNLNELLGTSFRELTLEERIENSSVVALAEFVPEADGRMRAVISEILKQEEGTVFYYEVGDEYTEASYYKQDKVDKGEGLVIFFVGSPAKKKMSMTYRGNRITGLGDLPIALLREKCGGA